MTITTRAVLCANANLPASRRTIEAHRGAICTNAEAPLLASFDSVNDAVECALALNGIADAVGVTIGDTVFDDGAADGAAIHEAITLCVAAKPGQVLASRALASLLGPQPHNLLTARVEVMMPGSEVLLGAVMLLSIDSEPERQAFPSALASVPREQFVGRENAIDDLTNAWLDVVAGHRRAYAVGGEPGIGKTRLCSEIARRAHHDGAIVLYGRCDEHMGRSYQPFADAIATHARSSDPATLTRQLSDHGSNLARLLPELATLVPGLAVPSDDVSEMDRYRLFHGVTAFLERLSVEAPVVLVIDDVHWADRSTTLLLGHVLRASKPSRALVLMTYRDTELPSHHPMAELLADLRLDDRVGRVRLSGLDEDEVAALMRSVAGDRFDETIDGLTNALCRETGGNPFFAAEVGRSLVEAPTPESGLLHVPESVRHVVTQRVAHLKGDAADLLPVAAVIGHEFDASTLAAAAGVDDETCWDALDEAARAGIVVELSDRVDHYRFAHAIVRQTLYDSLSSTRQVLLHRRVGDAIESLSADANGGGRVAELAEHFGKAVVAIGPDKAAHYATAAGDLAFAQFANDEAADYYGRALALLDDRGDLPFERRCDILISLGDAQRRAGRLEHRQTLLDAAGLAMKQGDSTRLARAALANNRSGCWSMAGSVDEERVAVLEAALDALGDQDDALRARVSAFLSVELMFAGQDERKLATAAEAVVIARRLGDQAVLADTLIARFQALLHPSTLAEREAIVEELHVLATELDDLYLVAQSWLHHHIVAMERGEITVADHAFDRWVDASTRLGQPMLDWMTGFVRAALALRDGQLDEADRLAVEAMSLGQRAGQPDALMLFAIQIFPIRLEQGRLAEIEGVLAQFVAQTPGLRSLQAALALVYAELDRTDDARQAFEVLASSGFREQQADAGWINFISGSSAVASYLGDAERAETLIELFEPLREQIVGNLLFWPGAVTQYLAPLLSTVGRFAEADSEFAHALEKHERMGMVTRAALTRLGWATSLARRGDAASDGRARELLESALSTATALGMANVERRAHALLDDLAAPTRN